MNVATLTLPLHTNYGGVLQAYALQKYLERLGHTSSLIELSSLVNLPVYKAALIKLKSKFFNSNSSALKSHGNLNFDEFIKNEIQLTSRIEFKFQLKKNEIQSFDSFVVGSDQVWRADYAHSIELYYFSFVKNRDKKLLSYAASFGADKLDYNNKQLSNVKRFIGNFNGVGVREVSGEGIVTEQLGYISPVNVVDPVFLLSTDDYDNLISKYSKIQQSSDFIFSYILDVTESKESIIKNISEKLKLPDYVFNKGNSLESKSPIGDWLNGFKTSKFVITDSFHGVVLSILYNKPFIAIGNATRGLSRFQSVLGLFGLNSRLITDGNCNVDHILNSPIDYDNVNALLDVERNKARRFLVDILDKDNNE